MSRLSDFIVICVLHFPGSRTLFIILCVCMSVPSEYQKVVGKCLFNVGGILYLRKSVADFFFFSVTAYKSYECK